MFREKANLSVGRVNHNYAAADVSWNHNDGKTFKINPHT